MSTYTKMSFDTHEFRVDTIAPYVLGSVAETVRALRRDGQDVIDLSQINPDVGLPQVGVDRLVQASLQPHNHKYSASQGITRLREAICERYSKVYGVSLNPHDDAVVTMGTKEGLGHLLLAMLEPGDSVVVPTPAYPVHNAAIRIAGGNFLGVPIPEQGSKTLSDKSNDFFEALEETVAKSWPKPKAMILNFPHNPTTVEVDISFFERLVGFAKAEQIYLLHDFSYSDIYFSDKAPPSILQAKGAKEVAVEFYSLSKSFGIPGWRVGFCLGNPRLVSTLKKIKSYLDFGLFQPLQISSIDVLAGAEEVTAEIRSIYQSRRDALCEGLSSIGWEVEKPSSTVFVWAKLPQKLLSMGSVKAVEHVLNSAGVAICPGEGFDSSSRDYLRFSLGENESRIRAAVARIEKSLQIL